MQDDLTSPLLATASAAIAVDQREREKLAAKPTESDLAAKPTKSDLAALTREIAAWLAEAGAKGQGAGVITTAPAAESSVPLAATTPPVGTNRGEGDGRTKNDEGVIHIDAQTVIHKETFSLVCGKKTCTLGNGKEFKLLSRLAQRPGKYISVETLIDDVWGTKYLVERATVKKTVSTLRAKLTKAKINHLEFDGKNRGHYAMLLK